MDNRSGRFFRTLGKIVAGILIAAVIALAVGALVMVLWNWLMTDIFSLRPITYWEGFGLVLLLRLLIGGFGESHSSSNDKPHRRRPHGHRPPRGCGWEHLDDMYEQWWENEGEEHFEQYMSQQEKKETPPEDKDSSGE